MYISFFHPKCLENKVNIIDVYNTLTYYTKSNIFSAKYPIGIEQFI